MLRNGVEYSKDRNEMGGVVAFLLRHKVLIQRRMVDQPRPTLPERSKCNLATTTPEFGLKNIQNCSHWSISYNL